jgi:hypothetical protein
VLLPALNGLVDLLLQSVTSKLKEAKARAAAVPRPLPLPADGVRARAERKA